MLSARGDSEPPIRDQLQGDKADHPKSNAASIRKFPNAVACRHEGNFDKKLAIPVVSPYLYVTVDIGSARRRLRAVALPAQQGRFAVALIYPVNVVRDVERRWKRRSQRPVAALPRND